MSLQCPGQMALAGEVVTTGTLTDAWPVQPGQHWRTALDDGRLPGLSLRCVA
jgi:2-keto-4-pentenoate hydratase